MTNTRQVANLWTEGCAFWMWEWVLYHECKPYYVTFMFHPLRGTPAGIIAQMHRGTRKGFYSRFCTEFAHHPRDTGEQKRLPRLMLFPDRPVCKRQNHSLREVSINDNGLHFQGPMIIPPESRFQGSVIDHIMENQPYAHHGIQRVYVKKNWHQRFQSIGLRSKDHQVGPGRSRRHTYSSADSTRTVVTACDFDRAIRDIQSRQNVSDEVAERIYSRRSG